MPSHRTAKPTLSQSGPVSHIVYLEAWLALRRLGDTPPSAIAKQVLGVVVEVGVEGGLDLVAVYNDLSAWYYDHTGAAVIRHNFESRDLVPVGSNLGVFATTTAQVPIAP